MAISRCKNEADIVEPWVRHTLAHVDHLVVSNNDSDDRTGEILWALRTEGLPLTIVQESTIGDYQARIATEIMRTTLTAMPDAEWIVPLDTDEFIECQGRFADMLTAGPPKVRSLTWKSMAWSSTDNQAELNPVVRMRQRLVDETRYQKVQVPRDIAMAEELCTGSHFLVPSGEHGMPVDGAHICHFPARSLDQFKIKSSQAYLQSLCVPGWDRRVGFQFSSLPEVARIDETLLSDRSRRYATQKPADWKPETADNPLDYRGGALRYTDGAERFMQVVLRLAEKLAARVADLTRGPP